MRFIGTIKGGKMELLHKEKFFEQVKKLEGKEIVVTLKKKSKPKSPQQRKYFHGVLLERLAEILGLNTIEEAKGVVKYVFKIGSTEDLNSAQTELLSSKIRTWASSELGGYIPAPNEPDYDTAIHLHD